MKDINGKIKTILSLLILPNLFFASMPQAAWSGQNRTDTTDSFFDQVVKTSRLFVKDNDSLFIRNLVELTVISHWCGNRVAAIDAISIVDSRKVSVRLSYDGSTDIYSNGERVDDGSAIGWWDFFCPSPSQPEHLTGVKVTVEGEWTGDYDDGWVLNASRLYFNVDKREEIKSAIIAVVRQPGLTEPTIREITLLGEYGLAIWQMGHAAGMVALVYDGDGWQVIRLSGGVPSPFDINEAADIPTDIATELLSSLGLFN